MRSRKYVLLKLPETVNQPFIAFIPFYVPKRETLLFLFFIYRVFVSAYHAAE
jgi:hypothetical protein